MYVKTTDLLEGKKDHVLHLLDALSRDRRERGALLYQLRDCLEVLLAGRDELCSHGVRAVLGRACGEVKRENASARAGLHHLIIARDEDKAFLAAVRELRDVLVHMRALGVSASRRVAA